MNMKNYDVIVIGAGPAGMAATIYLQRSNLKVCLIEKATPGGRMLQASLIDNYPAVGASSGVDIAGKMFSMIDLSKIDFEMDEVIDLQKDENFIVTTKRNTFTSKKVVIATGFVNKLLDNTNESDYIGKGISYCALCDAPLTKNKVVLALAQGAKAIEEINYIASIAKKVYLITNAKDNIDSKIEVLRNTKIHRFNGKFALESITIEKDNQLQEIPCQMAFLFNGYIPGTKFLSNLDITNKAGLIEIDNNCETKIKGLYAIGDVNIKDVKQVATAVGDGALVGSKIIRIGG